MIQERTSKRSCCLTMKIMIIDLNNIGCLFFEGACYKKAFSIFKQASEMMTAFMVQQPGGTLAHLKDLSINILEDYIEQAPADCCGRKRRNMNDSSNHNNGPSICCFPFRIPLYDSTVENEAAYSDEHIAAHVLYNLTLCSHAMAIERGAALSTATLKQALKMYGFARELLAVELERQVRTKEVWPEILLAVVNNEAQIYYEFSNHDRFRERCAWLSNLIVYRYSNAGVSQDRNKYWGADLKSLFLCNCMAYTNATDLSSAA